MCAQCYSAAATGAANLSYTVLSYYENPTWCEGCPRFQIDLTEGGNVRLHCFSGCAVPGIQDYRVPEATFQRLVSAFRESGFFKIPRLDTSRVVFDGTVVRLTYKDEEGVHETVDDGRKIPVLGRLEKQFREEVRVEPWLRPSLSGYQALVNSGWDVNTVGEDQQNGLTSAVFAGDIKSVNFLLRHGSSVTRPALLYSTLSHNSQIVETLLNASHLDLRSAFGGYLLRHAAGRDVQITRLLLRRGADANSQEPQSGMTPLMSAISSGSFANVSLLLDHGADVNLTDYRGLAPLGFAATQLNSGFIPLLLRRGAKVNSQDSNGRTALMEAAERCFYWNVDPLLAGGADPSITDKQGRAAFDLPAPANDAKCATTLNLLKSASHTHVARQSTASPPNP